MGVFKNEVGRPSNETIKKRNIFKFLCFVLVVIILLLVAYILNDKGLLNNNETTTKKDITTTKVASEELDVNSDEVMKLYIPFSYYTHDASAEELYKKDKVTPSDLSNEYKNRLAFAHYYSVVGHNNLYEGIYNEPGIDYDFLYLSSSTLEKYYKELFGKKEKYIPKDFSAYGFSTFLYYKEDKDIYYADQNAGDYTGYRYANEIYKVVKTGDKIEIYEYVVVYNEDYESKKTGVYKNIEDANNFQNAIKEEIINNDNRDQIKKYKNTKIAGKYGYLDDLSDYKDEASKYKLTFEKEDNNYIFKSVEKID